MNTINLALKKNLSPGHNLIMALKNVAVGLGAASILSIAVFLAFQGFNNSSLLASLLGGGSNASVTIVKDFVSDPNNNNEYSTDEFKFVVANDIHNYFNLIDDGLNNHNQKKLDLQADSNGTSLTVQESLRPEQDVAYTTTVSCLNNGNEINQTDIVWSPLTRKLTINNIKPGDDVICTFKNTLDTSYNGFANVVVTKDTINDPDKSFDFTLTGGLSGPNSLNLIDPTEKTKTFSLNKMHENKYFTYELKEDLTNEQKEIYFTSYECSIYSVDDVKIDPPQNKVLIKTLKGIGSIVNLDLKKNYIAECTFTNNKTDAGITVVKNVVPTPNSPYTEKFEFDIKENGTLQVPNFTLVHNDGQNNEQKIVPLVADKIYTVHETLTDPQKLSYNTSYECVSNQGRTIKDKGYTVSIDLKPNENFVCTFTNKNKKVSLTVKKVTIPAETNGSSFGFTMTGNTTDKGFSLSDGESKPVSVTAGNSYSITENSSGYNIKDADGIFRNHYLTSYDCTRDGVSFETGNKKAKTDPFNINEGDDVVCTFTNTRQSQINITKKTVPAGDTTTSFPFEIADANQGDCLNTGFSLKDGQSGFFAVKNILNGDESRCHIEETLSQNSGYSTEHECTFTAGIDGKIHDNIDREAGFSVDFDLYPGELVDCTFTNTKPVVDTKIIVHKVVINEAEDKDPNEIIPFTFKISGNGSNEPEFDLSKANPIATKTLKKGSGYIITEKEDQRYSTYYICKYIYKDGRPSEEIASRSFLSTIPMTLKDDSDIDCTFTNTYKKATITVIKDTVPDDSRNFNFSIKNGIKKIVDNFNLFDNGSNVGNKRGPIPVIGWTNTYTISEAPQAKYNTFYSCSFTLSSFGNNLHPNIPKTPGNSVDIRVSLGENVICTFTNECKHPGMDDTCTEPIIN